MSLGGSGEPAPGLGLRPSLLALRPRAGEGRVLGGSGRLFWGL